MKPELIARLLALPAVLERMNAYAYDHYNGAILWHGGVNFDPAFRLTGGGFHAAMRPFPGVPTVWMERLDPVTGQVIHSTKWAIARDWVLKNGELVRV